MTRIGAEPATNSATDGPLRPEAAQAFFDVFPEFDFDLVLAEPVITQPVFINFDERGRLWVVEYRQYPDPAGLKLLSHDRFWRAVYDRVPPPPPHHFPGLDRISIHEDTTGDGVFDSHRVFLDGLNIVTAVARGRGGVWVLNPPYLLFYPDRNEDDVPDGDPEVRLSGFGLEDTHSVVNSLCWGPDGWLYAAQGSTVTAQVTRPGFGDEPHFSMGQLIWRYHPETRRYEVFAEGGGNAFGVEIDAKGRVFSGHNGGNTRGFHYVQGGYLRKGFEKHGPLSNPYAFGFFEAMAHERVERFTHTFVLYEAEAFPERYRGKLFGVEPLQGRIVYSELEPHQSTFRTTDLGHPVTSRDAWFKPVDIKLGPDGALYVADWYDSNVNHYRNHEGHLDRDHGRVYRLKPKGAGPPTIADLARLSGAELAARLEHPNRWHRQTALRLLGDRRDAALRGVFEEMLRTRSGQPALEALWALNLTSGLDERTALETLRHPDPHVRLWTIRLLGDRQEISATVAHELARLAELETHLEARVQLAATLRRLPAPQALPLLELMFAQDDADERIPLMLWWALESKAESHPEDVLALFENRALWNLPLVENHILERLIRRYAMTGSRQDLLRCARLLELAPGPRAGARLVEGFERAYQGRSMANLPARLVEALSRYAEGSVSLGLRQGRSSALPQALERIANEQLDEIERVSLIQILGEIRHEAAVAVLLQLALESKRTPVSRAALTALQSYEDPAIGTAIASHYPSLPEEVKPVAQNVLASRAVWAARWLEGIPRQQIPTGEILPEIRHRLRLFTEAPIPQLLEALWPEQPPAVEMELEIARLSEVLWSGSGNPYAGKKLYLMACGACHKLFGEGGEIGPDLTSFQRRDLESMLIGIVNPSAEIREGYENYLVQTRDGRTLTGFLADRDAQVVVLRGFDGQDIVLARAEIERMETDGRSLMPEGLLDGLDDQQIRDLFAYLRSTQPLNE